MQSDMTHTTPTRDWSQTLQDEGTWERFKGKAREQWAMLTDQDLEKARANWEQFVGIVKEKTGEAADAINDKVREWTS